MDVDVSPTLLAAREKLLEDCIAAPAWNPPFRKPRFFDKPKRVEVAPAPPPVNIVVIDLDAERSKVEALRVKWREELAKKDAAVATASAGHTTPGDHYWEAEHKARNLYLVAANFLAAIEARR